MRFLVMVLLFWPMAAPAELPKALVAQVERGPDKYLDDMAAMIAGYGVGGAIDADALHNIVALARADARSQALRRLLGADLDGDGAVSGSEMRLRAATESAPVRGRLVVFFAKADADGDDLVTGAELQAYANAVAQKAYSEDKAAATYAIMGFDSDGDGRVTLAEVTAGVAEVSRQSKVDQKLQVEGYNHDSNQNGQGHDPTRGRQSTHLLPVGGEHDQGHHGETELQA